MHTTPRLLSPSTSSLFRDIGPPIWEKHLFYYFLGHTEPTPTVWSLSYCRWEKWTVSGLGGCLCFLTVSTFQLPPWRHILVFFPWEWSLEAEDFCPPSTSNRLPKHGRQVQVEAHRRRHSYDTNFPQAHWPNLPARCNDLKWRHLSLWSLEGWRARSCCTWQEISSFPASQIYTSQRLWRCLGWSWILLWRWPQDWLISFWIFCTVQPLSHLERATHDYQPHLWVPWAVWHLHIVPCSWLKFPPIYRAYRILP